MLTARNNPGAAALYGKIYVAGGNDGPYVEYYKSLEVYNIKADRWEFKASMIQQRSICRVCLEIEINVNVINEQNWKILKIIF